MLPRSKNTDILFEKQYINGKEINNRIVFNPMEGCDANLDGTPSQMTNRRYMRFGEGGAGLIWMEAVAICDEGRANPRQLFINNKTLDSFKSLVADVKKRCYDTNGYEPIIIMQATHSGRYSKPDGTSKPLIVYNNPLFEKTIIGKSSIVSDDYLKNMEENYAIAAKYAMEAGFDGFDIKACHRYLVSELLSAFTREGIYGGSFDNRTRFLRNAIENVKAQARNGFIVTSRLNMYDGFPYPYGFGVGKDGDIIPDFSEGIKLIESLDLPMVNITIGNPYVNPEVNRPCNGALQPYEKYEEAVAKLLAAAKAANSIKGTAVVCSGISGLKEEAPFVAAGAISEGYCTMTGFGRMSFAYPDFIKDIKTGLNPNKCCITCGKCTELMRAGSKAGCVIRDKCYLDIYRKDVMKIKE